MVVKCQVHDLTCFVKTGSSENGPNFGKSFYICPLYPQKCKFLQPSSKPPEYCEKHKGNILELQVYEILSTGEKRHQIRCKQGKAVGEFCRSWVINDQLKQANNKHDGLSCSSKHYSEKNEDLTSKNNKIPEAPESLDFRISANCINSNKANVKSVVTAKTQLNTTNASNASFREPVSIISSSSSEDEADFDDEEINDDNVNKRKTNQHQTKVQTLSSKEKDSVPAINAAVNEEELNRIKAELDKKKKLVKVTNVNVLPDKGARLKNDIEKLESALNRLQLTGNSRTNEKEELQNPSENKYVEEHTKIDRVNYPKYEISKDSEFLQKKTILVPPMPQSSFEANKISKNNPLWNIYSVQSVADAEMKTKIKNSITELQKSLNTCPKEHKQEENPKCLQISLLPHQRYALAWLMWRESHHPYGGILADDMGLGKTLTMISLILKQREKEFQDHKETNKSEMQHLHTKATLIVCLASILHHWKNEILDHCKKEAVKVYVYHGQGRIRDPKKLSRYDVVITSYDTLRAEMEVSTKKQVDGTTENERFLFSKKNMGDSPLLCLMWERIILDEAHRIKNPKTMAARAVFSIRSKYRWAVTGTPIHNNLSDLYSLVKFLCYTPFNDFKLWKKYIEIDSGKENSPIKLLMKCILLRRMKNQIDKNGDCLVKLPPKEVKVTQLELSENERKIYNRLYNFCRSTVAAFLQEKKDKQFDESSTESSSLQYSKEQSKDALLPGSNMQINKSFLLVMLLRLQQCCCHLSLLQKNDLSLPEDGKEEKVLQQLELLSLESNSTESSSSKSLMNSDLSKQTPTSTVPEDKSPNYQLKKLLSDYRNDKEFNSKAQSTKILTILTKLEEIRKESKGESPDKCVLVSQWTSMLEVIAEHIRRLGFQYSIIKGDVNVETRMEIVDDFNNNPHGVQIMLLSLKAGGVGLNLIGGNHLFILDIHWNPALENQACDRVYRLGQTKKVVIHKLICKDTIEEDIMTLQQRKLNLAKNVLDGINVTKNQLTLQDFQDLFRI